MARRFDHLFDMYGGMAASPFPPPPSTPLPALPDRRPISNHAMTELEEELRFNELKQFRDVMTESVHTEFQEHRDDIAASAPDFDEYNPPPSHSIRGYMQQDSPFSFDAAPINEKSFMEWYPEGNATLSFPRDDGQIMTIQNINLFMIEERCQLLSTAFEPSRSGPRLYLETLTPATAIPFLRYLYTGTYALASAAGDYYEDVPTSVLLHCQLYRLGDLYDLPELKSQAYVNVLRQCEFGCSSPEKPIDLCAAIRYTYQSLHEHENLVDAIINYCVSCFLGHRLAQDEEFKQLAYELRPFHQDLCRNSMGREFENETATAIIQMPFKPHVPETYASRIEPGNSRLADVVYHFHAGDDDVESPKKRKRLEPVSPPSRVSDLTLALRPRPAAPEVVSEDSASEDEGFRIVKRRVSDAGDTTTATACLSERDYEVLSGPSSVEEDTCDSESDTDTIVEVPYSGPSLDNAARALPIRNRNPAVVAAAAERADSDSDSDWSFV